MSYGMIENRMVANGENLHFIFGTEAEDRTVINRLIEGNNTHDQGWGSSIKDHLGSDDFPKQWHAKDRQCFLVSFHGAYIWYKKWHDDGCVLGLPTAIEAKVLQVIKEFESAVTRLALMTKGNKPKK